MNPVSKILIISGVVLILMGLIWQFGGNFLHLGKLPGDISIERPGFKFYFPIITCLLISLILTLLFWILRKF